MNTLLGLSRKIDAVTTFIGRTVSWLILVAVLVSAYNAMARYLGDALDKIVDFIVTIINSFLSIFSTYIIETIPIPRASNALLELQWYLYGAVFMLAAAYTLKVNDHIRIDVFSNSLKKSTRDKIDLFGHIFFLTPFCLLMIYLCWTWFWLSYNSGEISGNANGLVLWPAKLIVLIGFILLQAQAISESIKRYAILKGYIEDEHEDQSHLPIPIPEDIASPISKSNTDKA